jgi:hypothetical protein
LNKGVLLGDPDVRWRLTLKYTLRKQDGTLWIGLIWLMRGGKQQAAVKAIMENFTFTAPCIGDT